ncbi:MAG: zinc metalloprotease HtpX [Candidatus Aenigmarchaeota archaeon]|nr:zinc metalloprotease HtpX [Candidatus Aenigmarchaeota archaeon]
MLRTFILFLTLTVILLAVGFVLGGIAGMTGALIFAGFINFFSYWYSDKIVLRLYGATKTLDEGLKETVRKLANEAEIPVPEIYIIPSEHPNAFATGRNPEHSAVAITRGLTKLTKSELEGVIAHEIAHIKHRDTLVQTVAATLGGAISYLAMIGYWSLFRRDGNRDGAGMLIGIVLIAIFAPLAATLIKLAISRRREYAADHEGALLTRNPGALATALMKISEDTSHSRIHGNSATSHMWIVNPFRSDWFTGMFSTHPPIKRRIAKLERMTGKFGGENE